MAEQEKKQGLLIRGEIEVVSVQVSGDKTYQNAHIHCRGSKDMFQVSIPSNVPISKYESMLFQNHEFHIEEIKGNKNGKSFHFYTFAI